MKFILTFLFIWVVILPAIGSEFGSEECEYEDVIVRFPNTPVSYVSDVTAKTWNKDTSIRLATWMVGGKFAPLPSYEGRIVSVGENNIKILNVTRFDTGTYTLVLSSESAQVFLQYTSHLKVKVSPTNQCIPTIIREGDVLMAVLSPNVCGIPHLTAEWKNINRTLIRGNISVPTSGKAGSRLEVYTACAVGESLSCYQGDANKLCSNYSVSALQSQILVSVEGVISIFIFYVLIIAVLLLVRWKWEYVRKKLVSGTDTSETDNNLEEESHLMLSETTAANVIADGDMAVENEVLQEYKTSSMPDIKELKKYLIDRYKTMKDVSLYAYSVEKGIDVSQVYCELELKHLGTLDEKCIRIREAENTASENELFSCTDAESSMPAPALILGECGVGKSTWCKHLVEQWCQYHKRNMFSVEMTDSDSHVPNIVRFELLLYVPLKHIREGVSFMEHLKELLFANTPDYYACTTRYISEHSDTVLVLIDGFDEVIYNHVSIENLLKERTILPCLIALTSRPIGLQYFQKDGISLRLFQIQGMIPDKSKEYARKVLDMFCHHRGETLNIDHFWKFTKHMQVQSMCNTPLLCLSLMLFWINIRSISDDLTEVILTIVETYLRHAMTRERYRTIISKEVGKVHFNISKIVAKPRHIQYLTEYNYQFKILSDIAENLWCLKNKVNADEESIATDTAKQYSENDTLLCLETGMLITAIKEVFKRPQLSFSHTLLLDFFAALSIGLGKQELFTQCITTKEDVLKNCYMIHILGQIAPNIGQELMTDISKIFDKDNDKQTRKRSGISEPRLTCKIKCKKNSDKPWKWLLRLLYTNTLSNENLSILSDGLAFSKDLTHLVLELAENKNELIFRLPILPKLKVLRIDIENCSLLLQEEQKWKKVKFSDLRELVIKSLNVDVKTTGYISEAINRSYDLIILEFCPKDETNEAVVAPGDSLEPVYSCERLAEAVTIMTKLKIFRLHNLQVGEHLPALLDTLCRSPMIEIIDLINVREMGAGEMIKINGNVQEFSACTHHETTFTKSTLKTLQLAKTAMSEKSWSVLSERLERLSPRVLHIQQVRQSNQVLKELLQGIGKCADLNILSICNIRAINESVSFSALRSLNKLTTLTLCKIDIPESSWRELYYILARLNQLKVMSLACLKKSDWFIEILKTSKLKVITMKEIHLEEALWSKLGDEVRTLPKLKRMELVSCIMSHDILIIFQQKMKESGFKVEKAKTSQTKDSELLLVDIIVTSKQKNKSKDAEINSNISKN